MSGAIPPFPQYAFMAWCLVKAQKQLYLYLYRFSMIPALHELEIKHLTFFSKRVHLTNKLEYKVEYEYIKILYDVKI
jgi:hypothetical protein